MIKNYNPIYWGPLFWNLLYQIIINGNPNDSVERINNYNKIIDSIEHILPCNLCRYQTWFIINNKLSDSVGEYNEFIKWVYDLKFHINIKLEQDNISYHGFTAKLKTRSKFINIDDLWNLIFMITFSFDNTSHSIDKYITFMESIVFLLSPEYDDKFIVVMNDFLSIIKKNNNVDISKKLCEVYELYYGKGIDVNRLSLFESNKSYCAINSIKLN
ncbi:MAG: hypothetical protein Terrestrivirus1_228 [Terrestrivirus sp.]|uniref:Sulfhydryl oxidase n=1 Tax=Terrestrivirus sp. TaxID=2487775 RepID=A0A3G4ZLR5_9VIRU|nr:MAG: hypothetical protein Terrestrivirus1_228 [Terrestrivirus sp.]